MLVDDGAAADIRLRGNLASAYASDAVWNGQIAALCVRIVGIVYIAGEPDRFAVSPYALNARRYAVHNRNCRCCSRRAVDKPLCVSITTRAFTRTSPIWVDISLSQIHRKLLLIR